VQLALPNVFAAGVKLSTPAESIAGAAANSAAFAELQLRVKASGWVSLGPADMLVAQVALYALESSGAVTMCAGVKLGGSFAAGADVQEATS
jgi:hypothetical protein